MQYTTKETYKEESYFPRPYGTKRKRIYNPLGNANYEDVVKEIKALFPECWLAVQRGCASLWASSIGQLDFLVLLCQDKRIKRISRCLLSHHTILNIPFQTLYRKFCKPFLY
ncbi:MAG: hypothetical protein ACFB0B_17395 [Thermonemataceae bacterium]